MSVVHCIACDEIIGYERADKDSSKPTPVSPQHPETHSSGEHGSTVNAMSYRSESLISPLPTVGLNGPISTLLEELLVIIFDDVITSESLSCQCRRKRAGWWLGSPRCLASVSRTWRTIVFACPMLWRHVHLTPAQSVHQLQDQLRLSSPFPIHLTVHQWPFQDPIPTPGPFSIVALTVQLHSILSPTDNKGAVLAPASQRVESITVRATESSTYLNFIFQTWSGRGSKFPALRRVIMNGNMCATWSRSCFFDGRNAPKLEQLELNDVVIAHDAHRLPWGIRLNLTTLVWSAPVHKDGSLVVSVPCFHHVVSSFPSLTTLELHGHLVAFEFVTLESLEGSGITPLTHIQNLRLVGRVFLNAVSAYMLFHLLPSLRHVAVRGKACTGPPGLRTVSLALQALLCLPKMFNWPTALPDLEDLELECVDGHECAEWKTWCMGELEVWRQGRETRVSAKKVDHDHVARMQVHMATDETASVDTGAADVDMM